MRRLLLVAALTCWSYADEPKSIRLHTDPPSVQVYRVGTSRDGLISLPVREGIVEVPDGDFRLVFKANGYQEKEEKFDQFFFQPGVNDWPKEGLLVLQPTGGAEKLSQFYRLNRRLALTLGGISLSLLLTVGGFLGQKFYVQRRDRQIRRLGGEPREPQLGPYILLRHLGQGGCGKVNEAIHQDELFKKNWTPLAVKTLNQSLSFEETWQPVDAIADAKTIAATSQQNSAAPVPLNTAQESFLKRFLREAKVLERVDHPNIVKLHHYDLTCRQPYIAMEFVAGETLRDFIHKHPYGLEPALALKIILPICEAILWAHSLTPPILHRDLKPENVMITPEHIVKVMDFGLAHTEGQSRVTTPGDYVGTPQYGSVEALRGLPTRASDQFAIGLILFELLLGRPANPHLGAQAATFTILSQLPKLSDVKPELGELAQIVDRMSAVEQDHRYPSMLEATEALRRIAAGLTSERAL